MERLCFFVQGHHEAPYITAPLAVRHFAIEFTSFVLLLSSGGKNTSGSTGVP
jgi:hypothetical protein